MPEQVQQTTVNSFVRGLLTEATPLTYPKDFSVDEINCELERTGLRRRREGMEYEDGNVFSSFTISEGDLVHLQSWENVADTSGTEFLVIQIGDTLYFYDKGANPPSSGEKNFSVDLQNFNAGTNRLISEERISATSIKGNLVVTSRAIDPFLIEFDISSDSITTEKVKPRIRDFEWQGDTSTYFDTINRNSISEERKYDTLNAGWKEFPLVDGSPGFLEDNNNFPPLNLPWWVAGDPADTSDDDRIFAIEKFNRLDKGTSLIANGRIILNLFSKDRTAAVQDLFSSGFLSEIGGISLPIEKESTRFSTVTTFAGRVWFSGLSSQKNGSKVFFSKVVQQKDEVGDFFQQGDPASQQDPDLVDSDGGVIEIPQAANIKALFEFGPNLLVFAENGVWEIGGVDNVFKATEFFVRRVTGAEGLQNSATLVNAEGTPFWWSDTAIYTISREDASQQPVGQDISKQSIQTFWENIDGDKKLRAVGQYDPSDKRIYWLYEDNSETIEFKYNKILILDLRLQAFIPWEICDESSNTDYIVNMDVFGGVKSTTLNCNVLVDGEQVTNGTGTTSSSSELQEILLADFNGTVGTTFPEVDKPVGMNLEDSGGDITAELVDTVVYEGATSLRVICDSTWGGPRLSDDTLNADLMPHDHEFRFTIAANIRDLSPDPKRTETIISNWDSSTVASYLLRVMADKSVRFDASGEEGNLGTTTGNSSTVVLQSATGVITDGQWHEYQVERDGDDWYLRVDGTVVDSELSRPFTIDSGSTTLKEMRIGYWENNRDPFDGWVDAWEVLVGDPLLNLEEDQEDVIIKSSSFEAATRGIKFLVRDGDNTKLTFAEIKNRAFLDWNSCSYESYADTIYEFNQDLTTRKNNIYVTCYFEKTPTIDSSCFLESFWDTGTNVSSRQQVYRPRTLPGVSTSPFSSVISRNKIRGRGRALQLRFESETQKDFRLEGYEVINAKPK